MSKKKSSIKKFQIKDERSFRALSNCGHCTREQLLSINGMSDKRINNYVKDGLISKQISNKGNNTIEAYKLTDKGRKFINRQFGINHNYVPQNPHHDKALADKYFSLSEKEQASWKNETVLKNEFKEQIEQYKNTDYDTYKYLIENFQNGNISCVDCYYISELGQEIVYEVETNYYGQAEINAKISFCQIMKLEYNSIRV